MRPSVRLLLTAAHVAVAALAVVTTASGVVPIQIHPLGLFPEFAWVDNDTAEWTNVTQETQRVQSDDGLFDSGPIPAGGGYSLRLLTTGDHPYSVAPAGFVGTVYVPPPTPPPIEGPPGDLVADHLPDLPFPVESDTDRASDPDLGIGASKTRIVVRFRELVTVAEANNALRDANVTLIGALPLVGLVLVQSHEPGLGLPDDEAFARRDDAIASLRASDFVAAAAKDLDVELKSVPRPSPPFAYTSDSGAATATWQWGDPGPNGELWGGENWYLEADRAPQAWSLLEPIKAKHNHVDVAVIDDPADTSGDLSHVFVDQLCTSTGRCTKSTVAAGKDHGSHVSGTIAGTFDDGVGSEGIDPLVTVHSVGDSFLDSQHDGSVSNYVNNLQVFTLVLAQKLAGNWPDLRLINYSAAFPPVSLTKLQTRHPGTGSNCGPGANDDGQTGSNEPCSMQNDDKWLTDLDQVAQAAEPIAQLASTANVIIVQAAGNESNDYCAPLNAVPNTPGCTLQTVSAANSGEFIRVSRSWSSPSDNPIVGVESIGDDSTTPDTPGLGRSTFSNPGGDVSAPGAHVVSNGNGGTYAEKRGTSMAAPQVTGAIAYLLAYDPTLTISQLRGTIVQWAKGDTTGGAAARLDLFASLMSLPGAAKDLVDVNDRSRDGNQRVRLDGNGAQSELARLPIQPDREIDMRDFRAFRDAWLESCLHALTPAGSCPQPEEVQLDGAPDHKKRDLNLDGCVSPVGATSPDCPSSEDHFSRFDFNGDGVVDRVKQSDMPLDPNGNPSQTPVPLTDLQVLAGQWNASSEHTEGWTPNDLDGLMNSGDVEIHADDLFDAGAGEVEVEMTSSTGIALPTRRIVPSLQPSKSYIVATVPAGAGNTVTLKAKSYPGGTMKTSPVSFELKFGEDKRVDLCSGLSLKATPSEVAADGKQSSTIVASLSKCSDVEVANRPISWSLDNAAGGSLTQTDSVTQADGTAKAKLSVGTTPGTYKVIATVTLDNGEQESAEVKIKESPPVTITYVWQQHIEDWTESGSSKWAAASPTMPDCTIPGVVEYCIDSSTLHLTSEANGGLKRSGTLNGGGAEFKVTEQVQDSTTTAHLDWGLTLTNGQTQTGGKDYRWEVVQPSRYTDRAVDGVAATFDDAGLHVAGMQTVGDLPYPYSFSGFRTGTGSIDPIELHGARTDFMLIPQGGDHIRFAARPGDDVMFPFDAATNTYLPFQSCGVLERDLTTEPGYYVEGDPNPFLAATVIGRKPTYSGGDRPMPVGPGHLRITYSFGAVATVGGAGGGATPTLPDCSVNHPPTGKFDGPPESFEGRMTHFEDRSTDVENDITSWHWDFGDGEPAQTEQSPYHAFPDNGTYTVTLTVKDSKGATDTTSKQIVVHNQNPLAYVDEATAQEGQPLTFNLGIWDAGKVDKQNLDWTITSPSPLWPVIHNTQAAFDGSYTVSGLPAGVYPVTLTVTDKDQGSTTAEATMEVTEQPTPVCDPVTGVNCPPPPPPAPSIVCGNGPPLDGEEAAFLELVNAYRIQNGVPPLLGVSPTLQKAATDHAHDMAVNDYMAHVGLDGRDPAKRAWDAGYPQTSAVSENLAGLAETAFEAMWAWKSSTAGHNENMLDPRWRAIGIAREQGSIWRWATSYGEVLDCPSAPPAPPRPPSSRPAEADAPAAMALELETTTAKTDMSASAVSGSDPDRAGKDTSSAKAPAAARDLAADDDEPTGVAPAAAFTISSASPIVGHAVTITNRSRDGEGHPVAAELDFGDGSAPVQLEPDASASHAYSQASTTVVVGLTATDAAARATTVQRSVFVRDLPRPSLFYTGPHAQDATNKTLAAAGLLRDPDTGAPIVGATLTFTVGGKSASGTTDATGTARASVDLTGLAAISHPVKVSFAGNADYTAVEITDQITLIRPSPSIAYVGAFDAAVGKSLAAAARIRDATTGSPIVGGTVTFTLGSVTASGTTNADGVASAAVSVAGLAAGTYTLQWGFTGNADYAPRSTIATVRVVNNAPPVANAGGPYILGSGGTLLLDGGRSTDPDQGDSVAAYDWDLNGDGVTDVTGRTPRPLFWAELQTLLCTVACSPNQDYPVTLRVTDARGEQSAPASTTVRFASDFALFLGNDTKTVVPGQTNSFAVTVVASSDFHTPVTLSALDLPTGVTASFSVNPVTPPGVSVMTLTAGPSAPTGTFPIHVRGTAGGITHDVTDQVSVAFGLVPICFGEAEGTVVDTAGTPLSGVNVTGVAPQGVVNDTTDANGRFTLRKLPLGPNNFPSTVAATAVKAGYWNVTANGTTACGATTHLSLTMLAKQTGHVSGTIREGTVAFGGGPVTPTTNPVPAAVVVFETATVAADATGAYAADLELSQNNTPRAYAPTASAPGYWFQQKSVVADNATPKTVDFVLVKQCKGTLVGGTVLYPDGTPVVNHLVGFDADGSGFTIQSTSRTDANGNFTMGRDELLGYNNAGRNYFLRVFPEPSDPPGTAAQPLAWPLTTCGERSTRTFTFNRPTARRGSFEGFVREEQSHEPIAGATVFGYSNSSLQGNTAPSSVVTDADGHFRVDDILIGYDVTSVVRALQIFKNGYYVTNVNVTLVADQTTHADYTLLLQRFGLAQGHVRDAVTHAPIGNVRLTVPGSTGCSNFFCTNTDPNGDYSSNVTLGFRNAPNSASVTASADGYWNLSKTIAVTADHTTTTDFDLLRKCTPAKIAGTVVNALNQAPIPNATVQGGNRIGITDANGRFELVDVEPGVNNNPLAVLLTASATGFLSQSKTVTVFCGATITVDFGARQSALGIVAGTLTDTDTGLPIANAFVGGEFGGTATTDANGNYRITGVPLGDQDADRTWSITARPAGYAAKTKTFTAKANVEVRADFAFSKASNHAPVATPQSYSLDENDEVEMSLAGTDPDGDAVELSIASYPTHGLLSGSPPNLTYFPDDNYSGPDSFTYTAFDGQLLSTPATVTLQIRHVNRQPVARFDEFTVTSGVPTMLDVLANDSDADGGTLTITQITSTDFAFGTLSIVDNKVRYTSNVGYQGDAAFSYAISDGQGGTASTFVELTVVPGTATAPSCAAASFTATEDGSLHDSLACTGGAGALAYAVAQGPSHGTVTVDPSGSFTYTPAADYSGPDSFTFTAADGTATSAPATASITVAPVNDAPRATDDDATAGEDGSALVDVRANDATGPANESAQTLAVSGAGAALHGSALVLTSGADAGKVLYTPAPGFNGADSFSYTVCDDGAPPLCATATVHVTVTPVNDAPTAQDGTASLDEDAPSIAIDLGALVADDETADANLRYEILSGPSKGALSGSGPVVTYDSDANANGGDSFTYRVVDRGDPDGCAAVSSTCAAPLTSATRTVTIAIAPVNDAPVVQLAAPASVQEGSSAALHATATDVDGDALTYTWSAGVDGAGADATLAAVDGPATVPVSVTVSDGHAQATATQDVQVANVAPSVHAGGALAANRGEPVSLDGASLTDPGAQDTHTATVDWGDGGAAQPATVDGHAVRATHTYATAGTYTVTVTVTDKDGGTGSATTTASIAAPNHAPTATDASVSTTTGAAVAITLHASDADGDALTYAVLTQPAHGTLTGTPPGLTYTPAAGYTGPDSFTFKASDGKADSSTATVSITVGDAPPVNHAPTATDSSATTTVGVPVDVPLHASDPDGDSLTYAVVTQPAHGALSGVAPALTYTPAPGYGGPDSFTFRASDGHLDSNTATVSITVAKPNGAPHADDQTVTAVEGQSLDVTLAGSDPDGDALTFAVASQPAHGTLSGTAPHLSYTPSAGYTGPDAFTYTASDGSLTSSAATVSITVTRAPQAPVAINGSVSTDEDTPAAFVLDATDGDGDALTFTIVSGPAHGTLTGNGASRTYAPAANYFGPDSLTFKASDGHLDSSTATVTFEVRAVNDAPACDDVTLTVDAATPGEVAPTCRDVEGDTLTIALASQGAKGVASIVGGRLHYEPRTGESGTDTFTYRALDASAESAPAKVTVTINPASTPVNDPPRCTDSTASTVTTTPLTGSVRCTDADNDALAYAVATGPAHGTLTLDPSGSYLYVAAAGYTGPDAFSFTASDGRGGTGGATVHVTVVAKADHTAPSCAFAAAGKSSAGKQQVDATLRDTGSGLASIRVVTAVNATVAMPSFTVGTTTKVVVRTTEITSSKPNNVTLEVVDVAGNVTTCDPIVTTLTRPAVVAVGAKPYVRTFVGVPHAESKLRLRNGRPGLTRVDVVVNGRLFRLGGLRADAQRFVDLAAAMRPGHRNTIVLRPYGLPRSKATIMIADR